MIRNLFCFLYYFFSYSKLLLWTTFFWLCSRMSKLCHSYIRLGILYKDIFIHTLTLVSIWIILFFVFSALSDTDSLLLSIQRTRSELERYELHILLKGKMSIPFHESLTAKTLAMGFIRVFGRVLDWSSIDNEVYIYIYISFNFFVYLIFILFLNIIFL